MQVYEPLAPGVRPALLVFQMPPAQAPKALYVEIGGEPMELPLKAWHDVVATGLSKAMYPTRVPVREELAARVTLQQSLEGVDLAKLGTDLLGSADITGTGKLTLNLVASGSNLGAMRRGLGGDVAFTIMDGSVEGLDLWYELRRARARLDKAQVPERPAGMPSTKFSSLAASGKVDNAVLTNRDLNARLDFMSLAGAGTVNLLTDAVDFDLKATFIDGTALKADPDMAKYAGATVPLRVTGTIAAPTVLPDFGAIVKARVQQEISRKLEEKTELLRDKLRERLGR